MTNSIDLKTIASRLRLKQRELGSKTAIALADGRNYSYDELVRSVDELSENLGSFGLQSGMTVAVTMANGFELIASILALMSLNVCALILNPELTEDEFEYALTDSRSAAVIVQNDNSPACNMAIRLHRGVVIWPEGSAIGDIGTRGLPDNLMAGEAPCAARVTQSPESNSDSENAAILMYTSGTTSRPKGVPLTQSNLVASAESFIRCFALSEQDVALMVMPLFHIHGLAGVTFSTLVSGGTVVVAPKFSASSFWQLVTTHGVTWYSAAPTIHRILLRRAQSEPLPPHNLRFVRFSSAPMSEDEIIELEKAFDTAFLAGYGLTEAANQVTCNPLPPGKRKHSTVGTPQGVDVAILDCEGTILNSGEIGEICIKGPSIMKGYLNSPEENAGSFVNGWLRTGDQGFIDDEGYLSISGRLKDLIIRGGENIAPQEVELVLLKHPRVLEAVCFGLKDTKYGEEVFAAAVVQPGLDEKELLDHCRLQLSSFKVPKAIYFTDSLPKNATNKILRHRVAEMFGAIK